MNRVLAKASLIVLAVCMLVATSSQAQTPRATPVGVGETAPDFALQDHRGHKITLSDSRGKSPVVLVFYRGYW
jgi:cytochrome oxidase Cu insertion factor (SCO1/SenC/PrrC family)